MGKFDGVLLASDFDNTLIYTEDALRTGGQVPTLSKGNREALEYFTGNGGLFTISTGRALAAFEHYAPMLPINAPGIVCNGAAIYDFAQKEYLEFSMLEETALERGQQVLEAFPTVACEAYHPENVIHAVHPNEITRKHAHLTHVEVEEKASLLEVPLPLGKLLFEEELPVLEQVKTYLTEKGWAGDYELIFSTKTLLELTKKGASKGGMVLRLAELLHIDPRNLYCAGDEANDLSMLKVAAEGFAPENCIEAVRQSGATIVSDARKDAMADIIARLDKKY
ncbi:MAG: HAD-IIB family hydrolase [Oscillibacter sp.]|jgi:Cof subfamily protein (haloacid dehalogenase superfamily)|nr:HAD-IIB family hydrolase [Oscillibacter sp.]